MGHRKSDGSWHDSCLHKLKSGEPFFVLRAQDLLAPVIIRQWATMAEVHGLGPEKAKEAMDTAKAMEAWPDRKYPD